MKLIALALVALLAGCAAPLPQIASPGAGCNVRAGVMVPEGAASGGFGGGTIAAAGASASIVGECPPNFHVFERSAGGGWVFYGDFEVLKWYLENAPLEVTARQLRQIATGD